MSNYLLFSTDCNVKMKVRMANNVIYFRFLKQFKTGIEKPRFKAEADRL